MELTRSEMEIMDVLWEAGKPLSRADLLEHTEEKTWKDSSVHILLNSLLQKGAIQEAGLVKRGKTFGRVFAPTVTREEYFANTIFSHRHKPEPVGLFRALLKREEVTPGGSRADIGACAERNTVRDWRSRLYGSAFLLEIHAGFPWGSGTGFAAAPPPQNIRITHNCPPLPPSFHRKLHKNN